MFLHENMCPFPYKECKERTHFLIQKSKKYGITSINNSQDEKYSHLE